MFFPSSVTQKKKVSNDGWKDTFGTPTTLSCKYSKVEKLFQGQNEQYLTCAWIQFPPGTTILKTDQLTLPDGTTAPIISIVPVKNPFGLAKCVEVWTGEKITGGL